MPKQPRRKNSRAGKLKEAAGAAPAPAPTPRPRPTKIGQHEELYRAMDQVRAAMSGALNQMDDFGGPSLAALAARWDAIAESARLIARIIRATDVARPWAPGDVVRTVHMIDLGIVRLPVGTMGVVSEIIHPTPDMENETYLSTEIPSLGLSERISLMISDVERVVE